MPSTTYRMQRALEHRDQRAQAVKDAERAIAILAGLCQPIELAVAQHTEAKRRLAIAESHVRVLREQAIEEVSCKGVGERADSEGISGAEMAKLLKALGYVVFRDDGLQIPLKMLANADGRYVLLGGKDEALVVENLDNVHEWYEVE